MSIAGSLHRDGNGRWRRWALRPVSLLDEPLEKPCDDTAADDPPDEPRKPGPA